MIISTQDKNRVLEDIKKGMIDAADVSFPNLIDEIILKMKKEGILQLIGNSFADKRSQNLNIPLHILLTLAITAKMKLKTSLTDIPFAITSADTLSEIGWNIWDNERGLEQGLMDEGAIRNYVKKYTTEEFIEFYNDFIQNQVIKHLNLEINTHILDCTEIEVNLENENYEKSEVIKDEDGIRRGYKMASIRGIMGDTGILEEIKLGSIKPHDINMCYDMVLKSKAFKEGDILINDRGFISRELMNSLKTERGVDTYIPLKKNMEAYEQAVSTAKYQKIWAAHPNKKRKKQKIAFVEGLKYHWQSDTPQKDVDFNACVVHDTVKDEYFVFITTDLSKSAKQIIQTYELRPEIEEDYRQIKDFWKLEDFKSTKYNFIAFHIVMVLMGYLFFQVYIESEDGNKYSSKSLPVVIKNYVADRPKTVIIYSGQYFGIFGFLEFIQLYSSCGTEVKACLDPILAKV